MQDLRLVRDKFTHVSRGFAFLHFHSVCPSLAGNWFIYSFLSPVFHAKVGSGKSYMINVTYTLPRKL